MQLTVFGASGGVGTHVVALAAQRGHQVRAVYRTTTQPPPPQRAEVLLAPTFSTPLSSPAPSAAPTWWSPPLARTSPPATTPARP